jgi:XTP/dITP diphosphohydrolase
VDAWVVATRSRGKLAELLPILAAHGVAAVGLDDAGVAVSADEDDIELHDTFEANALAKASYFAARTGRPCLADDSGLCIDALRGRPGVRSRRFARDSGRTLPRGADEDIANSDAMLEACWNSGWAPPWAAHFVCAAALADGTRTLVETGRTHGTIVPERAGVGGFGYDPWFVSDELRTTFAVASRNEKARVSHRARAFAALMARLV